MDKPLVTSIKTVDKIHGFRTLVKGWSYGEGELFKNSVLNNTISLLQEASNVQVINEA